MKGFLRVFQAEFRKTRQRHYHGIEVYFSTLIWPAMDFALAFFMVAPFRGEPSSTLVARFGTTSIASFLLLGVMAFSIFLAIAESAWEFSLERFEGTLELLLLSPANRLAVVLGSSSAAIVTSIWLLVGFLAAAVLVGGWTQINLPMALVAIVGLLAAGVAWGALLESVFISSRDAGFLFALTDQPVAYLAGVRFPARHLVGVAGAVSALVPLRWALEMLRAALLSTTPWRAAWPIMMLLFVSDAAVVLLAAVILHFGEQHARRQGSAAVF
jgi:ABC-2 type transport system permease protein